MNKETTVRNTREVRLAEKERHKELLFNATDLLNVSCIIWDAELRIVYGNQRWLTGYRYYLRENCPSSASAIDLIHQLVEGNVIVVPDGVTNETYKEQLFEAIQFQAKGFGVLLKDGQTVGLYTHSTPEGGCMTYFRENETYATKEATRQINQSTLAHSRLTEALDSIDEGFILYDKNNRLILANRAIKELVPSSAHLMTYGRPREEILSSLSEWGELIDADQREVQEWIEYCNNIQSGTRSDIGRQFELKRKDGRIFLASAARTSEGGSTVTWKDVTESKKTEERARAIVIDAMEALDEGICLYDKELRFEFCNKKYAELALGGIQNAPTAGMTRQEIFRRFFEDGSVRPASEMNMTSDEFIQFGHDAITNYRKNVQYNNTQGRTLDTSYHETGLGGYLASVKDVTEQIALQTELDQQREIAYQSEKLSAMGELLAGVAHELNNPLSVVVGYSMMMQTSVEDQSLKKQVDNIAQAADRCSRIVKAFLAMARQRPMELTQCSLNEALLAALDIVGHRLRKSEIDVEINLDENLPDVEADEDQIIQVISNLLVNAENALEGHPEPRRLILKSTVDQNKKHAVVSIADSGPGIPADVQSRIFEPFFTTKEVGEGTGIGLAFCHRVVKSHDGELTVHSQIGKGAEFRLLLPCKLGIALKESIAIEPVKHSSGRILVVDDEAGVADMVTDILSNAGYETEKRYDSREALSLLRSDSFDAVLSDMRMPGLDGPALYAELKKMNPVLASKMAFITGDTLSKDVAEFLSETAQPYLEKPVTPNELLILVSDLISQD